MENWETAKALRDKLVRVWEKDIMRDNKGWIKSKIRLGKGICKAQGLTKMNDVLSTIEDFGIDMDLLDATDPSQDELYQIYRAIKSYRFGVKYLKSLKTKMENSNHDYNH